MISIKKNEAPDLKRCHMLCDGGLNKKLEKYPLTDLAFNKHQTTLVCARPGAGKSSLVYGLFKGPLKKIYHKIFVFMPANSRESMADKIFDCLDPGQVFDELTVENLEQVMSVISGAEEKLNHCIILDDMGSYLKDHAVAQTLKMMCSNKRHLRLSLFCLTQTYLSTPREVRKLWNNIILFKINKQELQTVAQEQIEDKDKVDNMNKISKIVFDKPHNFMLINVDSGRIFKNWDELIFKGDEL
tara:strand:- start:772 stop:1500 length:729 start_codon:yes stop_codon:yes gene_type:complete